MQDTRNLPVEPHLFSEGERNKLGVSSNFAVHDPIEKAVECIYILRKEVTEEKEAQCIYSRK